MTWNDRIEALLAPISADAPCGVDLSFSAEFDRIQEARREDDPDADYGEWQTELKQADWPLVIASTMSLLQTRSKDLRLAAWLAEALVKTKGFAGLVSGLEICAALLGAFGTGLYPRAQAEPLSNAGDFDEAGKGTQDDQEQRIASLSWMAGRLAQLAGELRLPEQGPPDTLSGLAAEIVRALGALDNLKAISDRLFGADGPAYHALQTRLAAADARAKHLCAATGLPAQVHGSVASTDRGDGAEGIHPTVPTAVPAVGNTACPIAISSRVQAISLLQQAARFFRENEPHSPVSYLLDKAQRWSAMPLDTWLRSVVKDTETLARLEEMLGLGRDAGVRDG